MTTITEAQRRLEIRNAVSGVALTERDERLLDWLATWDADTTTALADLITRSRDALPGPVHTGSASCCPACAVSGQE